jgi:lipopolysaccharide export system permease protein
MKLSKFQIFKLFSCQLSVLDRYIAVELSSVFLFSVGIFSSVGVAVGTLSDLANKIADHNLPLLVAVQVFILKIPEYASYALPISVLLATLMIYGRLSNDSEIIALRSFGISVYRLVAPAIALSFVVTTISFFFNELVVPTANYQATLIQQPFIPDDRTFSQKQDIFYPEYELVSPSNGNKKQVLKNLFYAEEFDGKKFKKLTVISWFNHQVDRIIVAKSAIWNSKQDIWDFYRGYLDELDSNIISFEHKQFALSKIPFILVEEARDPYEMNISQGLKYLEILKFSQDEKKILMLQVRIQQKIAFPFICLIFGTIGAALSVSSQGINKSKSFGVSVMVVFLYYLLGFLIGALGLIGVISPFWAAWLPNFLGLGIGWKLLAKTSG